MSRLCHGGTIGFWTDKGESALGTRASLPKQLRDAAWHNCN